MFYAVSSCNIQIILPLQDVKYPYTPMQKACTVWTYEMQAICKIVVRYYILWMGMIIAEMYNSLQSATAEEEDKHFTPTINSDSDEPQ